MNNKVAWIRRVENRIGELVCRDKLHVRTSEIIEGPLTFQFKMRLLDHDASSVSRFMRLEESLALGIGASSVRIFREGPNFVVEVPHFDPWTPKVTDSFQQGNVRRVPVGINSRRAPVYVNWDRSPHIAMLGPTGNGKTHALRAMLVSATRDEMAEFVVLARKNWDWYPAAKTVSCKGIAITAEDIKLARLWIDEQIKGDRRDKRLLVVFDDLQALSTMENRLSHTLETLLSVGRDYLVSVLITTQALHKNSGITHNAQGNLSTRIVFGAPDKSTASMFAGVRGTGVEHTGSRPGDALLVVDGNSQRIATPQCEPEELELIGRSERPITQAWRKQNLNEEEFDLNQLPTDREIDLVKRMFEDGKSKTAICITIYGSRRKRTWNRINEILEND